MFKLAWSKNGTPNTLSGTADDCDITDLTAYKFNVFLSHEIPSGNIAGDISFNNNSNTVYASRKNTNGGGEVTQTSKTFHELNTNYGDVPAEGLFTVNYTCSISGEEKLTMLWQVNDSTAGETNAPERVEFVGKFVPSPDADITRIDYNNAESGDFAAGSNLSALGTD